MIVQGWIVFEWKAGLPGRLDAIKSCATKDEAMRIIRMLLEHNSGPYFILESWTKEKMS